MNTYLVALLVFSAGYILNIFYITVLYHRGIAHGAVQLSPALRQWTIMSGSWITGIDLKSWACMHRLHHAHSDTALDPHSPIHYGVFGVMLGQLRSYQKTIIGLAANKSKYADIVKDLDFPVHWLNRKKMWLLPYALHIVIAAVVVYFTGSVLIGVAYWAGIMSHPIQGWMVNSFAHRYGYRNFEVGDHSQNNTMVAWLVMGEGYQNNHHAKPLSPRFSHQWYEIDLGYGMCIVAEKMRLLKMRKVRRTEKARFEPMEHSA